jgi:hypothetical protein
MAAMIRMSVTMISNSINEKAMPLAQVVHASRIGLAVGDPTPDSQFECHIAVLA